MDATTAQPLPTTARRVLVHTSRQTLRWADMDELGHVNNTVYFRYMEQARIEWLYAWAQEHPQLGRPFELGEWPVIVNASATFLVPLVYPGDIEVRMYLSEPGRSSCGSDYEIHCEGRKFAEGAARLVWIDVKSGRPVPLPSTLAAFLQAPDR